VVETLEQAAGIGAKAAWVLAAGFAEAGPEGEALQRDLAATAARHGLLVCGPNCVGMFNLHARSATYSVALPAAIPRGRVGGVFQSGAVCMGIANSNRGLGFSTIISSGNEALLDSADYIAHLARDPETSVILAFLEGIRQPAKFLAAARLAREAGKPVLVVKVGRSAIAQRAALAHTGALAGSNAVHEAVFAAHGIVRLDSLDELLEAAELFLKASLPAGPGIGMLTLSGGQIGLIGDEVQATKLECPELSEPIRARLSQVLPPYSAIANPLDAWGAGNFEQTYPACTAIVADEPAVDLIAVSRDSPPGIAAREVWQSSVIVDAAAEVSRRTGKPVVVFSNIANGCDPDVQRRAAAAGLPLLQGTRASVRALDAFVRYAAWRRSPPASRAASPIDAVALADLRRDLARQPSALTEHAAKMVLAAYGIPVTREALAASGEQAVERAEAIGYPVALKVQSPDVPHKTEAGAIALGVGDAEGVRRAFDRLIDNVSRYDPRARIDGVLVQEMVAGPVAEVIVGSLVDAEFGPVVVFGLGGIFAEVFQDSALRLAPVDRQAALDLVAGIRAAPLLRGFRGRPAGDVEAVADVIVRLSHLAADLQDEVSAVDINPLMVLPAGRGVRAADALVVRRTQPAATVEVPI
jgi:acetate---CoA ligase (ADP-forming)